MTRAVGSHIVKTPCCGTLLSTTAYASINFTAWEYWTDGHAEGSLAPTGDGLRRCSCGTCFLLDSVEIVITIRGTGIRPSKGWGSRAIDRLTRFLGRESHDDGPAQFDNQTANEIEPEWHDRPPYVQRIAKTDLEGLIASKPSDIRVEATARRLYWRHLNDPFREVYRNYRIAHEGEVGADGNSVTFPEYRPTALQIQNMEQLANILQTHQAPNWLELAELHRELGDFSGATAALSQLGAPQHRLHFVIEKLITSKVRGPVKFNY